MTLFEYLAVAFSLIVSATAMRLVGGLPHAFDAGRRYWVHLGIVGVQLVATLGVFWVFWSYRDIEWNLGRFALALSGPSLIYFCACTLIPENPESVASWREHYYAVRVRYFGACIAWAVFAAAATTAIVQMPWTHPARVAQTTVLVAGVVGCASASPRVHAGLVLAMSGIAVLMLVLLARPGSLVP